MPFRKKSLEKLLKEAKLTQVELGEEIDKPQSTIYRWLHGQSNPTIDSLDNLSLVASKYNIDINFYLTPQELAREVTNIKNNEKRLQDLCEFGIQDDEKYNLKELTVLEPTLNFNNLYFKKDQIYRQSSVVKALDSISRKLGLAFMNACYKNRENLTIAKYKSRVGGFKNIMTSSEIYKVFTEYIPQLESYDRFRKLMPKIGMNENLDIQVIR